MTFAKGVTSGYLPLGGVMLGDRVADVLVDKGGEFYPRLHLFGSSRLLRGRDREHRLIQRENLVTRVATTSVRTCSRSGRRSAEHPLVGETRMVG